MKPAPWRWIAAVVAAACLACSWAFASADAPYSNLEGVAAALYATAGALTLIGAALVWRRPLLAGLSVAMLTFAFRAWEICVIGNHADLQTRLIGACVYLMLFVLTLGLGLAFVRWEAAGGRARPH